jgi:hypothetical protein
MISDVFVQNYTVNTMLFLVDGIQYYKLRRMINENSKEEVWYSCIKLRNPPMRQYRQNPLTHIFPLIWMIVCFTLFYKFSGQFTAVQSFVFTNLPAVTGHLALINTPTYILNLLLGFRRILLFSLACTPLGLGILRVWMNFQSPDWSVIITAFILSKIVVSLTFLVLNNVFQLKPAHVEGCLGLIPPNAAF